MAPGLAEEKEPLKKVFFGSMFAFNPNAVDELVDKIKNCYDDLESAPFLSYLKEKEAFSCAINSRDTTTEPTLLAQLKNYVHLHCHAQQLPDIGDEPRLIPFKAVRTEREIPRSTSFRFGKEDDDLVDCDEDSGSESEVEDALHSLDHVTAYWLPKNGDIHILPKDFAENVAATSGCACYPEPELKRIRLVHGDFNLALRKFHALEPLLVLLSSNRSSDSTTTYTNGNVLVLTTDDTSAAIKFVKILPDHKAYSRVIVGEDTLQSLYHKYVGELRTWNGEVWIDCPNLELRGVSQTHNMEMSNIWKDSVFKSFGDAANAFPQAGSDPSSARSSQVTPHDQGFLGPSKAARVAAWSTQIDPKALGPAAVTSPEPFIEDPETTRVRVARDDSDDSDDEVRSEKKDDHQPPPRNRQDATIDAGTAENTVQTLMTVTNTSLEIARHYLELAHYDVDLAADRYFEASASLTAMGEIATSEPPPVVSIKTPGGNPKVKRRIAKDDNDLSKEAGHTRTVSLATTLSAPSSSEFDPDAYGGAAHRKRAASRGARESFARGRGHSNNTPPSTGHTRGSSQPKSLADTPRRGSVSRRGLSDRIRDGMTSNQFSSEKPVQIGAHVSAAPAAPPPRSKIRFDPKQIDSTERNLIDLDSIDIPAIKTGSKAAISDISRPAFSGTGKTGVNLGHFELDAKVLRERAVNRLRTSPRNAVATPNATGTAPQSLPSYQEKKQQQEKDESTNRKLHSTMDQQAGNPGKSVKPETNKERIARLKAVVADAYGKPSTPKASGTAAQPPAELTMDDMSRKKRQLLRNNLNMAAANAEASKKVALQNRVAELTVKLSAAFEAGRAFSGTMWFEFQFGQVLYPSHSLVADGSIFDRKAWNSLFGFNSGEEKTRTSFTKIMTINGADIDRILETRAPQGSSTGLWNKASPGLFAVRYVFECQSKSNQKFQLVINQDGQHQICKGTVPVGAVNIHFPGQIWDASAILQGVQKWLHPPDSIVNATQKFVESLHILPNRTELLLYFRLPSSHHFTVRAMRVHRVSLHDCRELGWEDIQLQVTETKLMLHRSNEKDAKLWMGFEKDYASMVKEGKIHYEVSLLHKSINEVLAQQNTELKLGELTSPSSTGKNLLDHKYFSQLMELGVYMVSKMDFVGAQNIGSMQRHDVEQAMKKQQLMKTLGPRAQSSLQPVSIFPASRIPSNPVMKGGDPVENVEDSGTARHSTITVTATPAIVLSAAQLASQRPHGVRAHTTAEIIEEVDGSRYAIGMGGARIPVYHTSGVVSQVPLAPEDSASQVVGSSGDPANAAGKKSTDQAGFW